MNGDFFPFGRRVSWPKPRFLIAPPGATGRSRQSDVEQIPKRQQTQAEYVPTNSFQDDHHEEVGHLDPAMASTPPPREDEHEEEESEHLSPDESDPDDPQFCNGCFSSRNWSTMIECSYCGEWVHLDCYNNRALEHDLQVLHGVPEGEFACKHDCFDKFLDRVKRNGPSLAFSHLELHAGTEEAKKKSKNGNYVFDLELGPNVLREGYTFTGKGDQQNLAFMSEDRKPFSLNVLDSSSRSRYLISNVEEDESVVPPVATTRNAVLDASPQKSQDMEARSNQSACQQVRATYAPVDPRKGLSARTQDAMEQIKQRQQEQGWRLIVQNHETSRREDVPSTAADGVVIATNAELFHLMELEPDKTTYLERTKGLIREKLLKGSQRAMMREWFVMCLMMRLVGTDAEIKGGKPAKRLLKEAIIAQILSVLKKEYQFTRPLWEDAVLDEDFDLSTFFPTLHIDPALNLSMAIFCEHQWPLRPPGERQEDRSTIYAYLTKIIGADQLGMSLLTWPLSIVVDDTADQRGVQAMELLKVDATGYVTNPKSSFRGLRNARTWKEWISLFYFVVLTTLSEVSTSVMPSKTTRDSLAHNCDVIRELMLKTTEGVRHTYIFKDVFKFQLSPVAVVLSAFLQETFKHEGHTNSPAFSTFRIGLLVYARYIELMHLVHRHPRFTKLQLSVADLYTEPIATATERVGAAVRPLEPVFRQWGDEDDDD